MGLSRRKTGSRAWTAAAALFVLAAAAADPVNPVVSDDSVVKDNLVDSVIKDDLVVADVADVIDAWRTADGPRTWKFPEDHGAHLAYKTEWWYFTGNLAGPAGEKYGYELTFFRNGVRTAPSAPANPWSVRDLFLAHFTLTDVTAGAFRAEDVLSRSGPGLAGARAENLDVWIGDWSARMKDGMISLRARRQGLELALELTPRKPVVLHGRGGLSRKGPAEGQASYYSSLTDLETRGMITFSGGDGRRAVSGRSWFDHEFGSGLLAEDQIGWDWFGLHLSDGRDLMIYLLRRKDGSIEGASAGTLVAPDGSARPLALRADRKRGDDQIKGRAFGSPLARELYPRASTAGADPRAKPGAPADSVVKDDLVVADAVEFSVTALDRWRSPRSGGTYPSRWRIAIPSEEIDLWVSPLAAGQELLPATLPNLIYWEGAVAGTGTVRGRPASCEGYAELTGYAGSLRGIF
jgi:predicted secreted hydrolase